jgi:hypothetical protein
MVILSLIKGKVTPRSCWRGVSAIDKYPTCLDPAAGSRQWPQWGRKSHSPREVGVAENAPFRPFAAGTRPTRVGGERPFAQAPPELRLAHFLTEAVGLACQDSQYIDATHCARSIKSGARHLDRIYQAVDAMKRFSIPSVTTARREAVSPTANRRSRTLR